MCLKSLRHTESMCLTLILTNTHHQTTFRILSAGKCGSCGWGCGPVYRRRCWCVPSPSWMSGHRCFRCTTTPIRPATSAQTGPLQRDHIGLSHLLNTVGHFFIHSLVRRSKVNTCKLIHTLTLPVFIFLLLLSYTKFKYTPIFSGLFLIEIEALLKSNLWTITCFYSLLAMPYRKNWYALISPSMSHVLLLFAK